MKKSNNLSQRIENTLNSLDGMRSASPGPYFYTRLEARLSRQEKNFWEKSSAFIARPAVALTVILTVILMNTLVIFQNKNPATSLSDQSESSVYEEYNLASNSFYDYEITEP